MSTLVELHLASLRAAGASPETVRVRGIVLRAADRAPELSYGVEAACEDELVEWLGQDGWSANTRATYAYHLRAFYAWASRHHLDYDPMGDIARAPKRRAVPRPVTDDHLGTLLTLCVDPVLTCVVLAAYAGLRCCEVAAVMREDITPDTLTVRGKGGSEASVSTHPLVWSTVEALPRGRVILAAGGRADADWVSRTCRRRFHRLGVPTSLHRLRHWHGTMLRRSGADLFLVQQALRHRSIQSTQGYVAVGDEERGRAVRALPVPGVPC
jgi:integrase/recombinase XerD